MVQHLEIDLAVGDVLRVGDTIVTVIDIENGEITFKIDDAETQNEKRSNGQSETVTVPLPR
jgi:hypothetical protein